MFVRSMTVIVLFLFHSLSCTRVSPTESQVMTSALDRLILGVPQDYEAQNFSTIDEQRLQSSMYERRRLGWQIAEKIFADVKTNMQHPQSASELSVPLWQSWYDSVEFKRMFERAMQTLPSEERRHSGSLIPLQLRMLEIWNAEMIRGLPNFREERISHRLAQAHQTAESARSLSGTSRILYSPSAARHLLSNYVELVDCYKRLSANPEPLDRSGPSSSNHAPCFTEEFPSNSVIVKALWQRSETGGDIEVFDTSLETIDALLKQPHPTWQSIRREDRPSSEKIYRMQNERGEVFDLVAMHIMTKELRHWVWVTLWWSPEANEDFGSDRNAFLSKDVHALKNYKMCTVTDFVDYSDDDTKASWCSNPYLETGVGMVKTNCVGCHQHAVPGIDVEEAHLSEDTLKTRQNFPFDYVWSLGVDPENLGAYLNNTLDYYQLQP